MESIEKIKELISDLELVSNKQVIKFILNEIGNETNQLMEELCQF